MQDWAPFLRKNCSFMKTNGIITTLPVELYNLFKIVHTNLRFGLAWIEKDHYWENVQGYRNISSCGRCGNDRDGEDETRG